MENQANCDGVAFLPVEGEYTSEQLLKKLGDAAQEMHFAEEGYTQALIDREKAYPTGLSVATGIAIPHADPKYTQRPGVLISVLKEPVVFQAMGGGEDIAAKIVFLLFFKDPQRHLGLLRKIMSVMSDKERADELAAGHTESIARELSMLI